MKNVYKFSISVIWQFCWNLISASIQHRIIIYMQLKYRYSNQKHDCQDLVKCMKKKKQWSFWSNVSKYIYFIRKMKVRLLSFAQYRILFNNSEDLHTTMSIKMHLHIKATRLFSTQEIYNKGLNTRYMYGWYV